VKLRTLEKARYHERVQYHATELLDALVELYPKWRPSLDAEEMTLLMLTATARRHGHDALHGLVESAVAVARLLPPETIRFWHKPSEKVPNMIKVLAVIRTGGR
jgi:hypothetical protein